MSELAEELLSSANRAEDYSEVQPGTKATEAVGPDNEKQFLQIKSISVPSPQLEVQSNKRTLLLNSEEIAHRLQRTSKQVTDFLLYEISTVGKFDDIGHFCMKGRIPQQQIEKLLGEFFDQYVECKACQSVNTTLTDAEEFRKLILVCQSCSFSRKVPAIIAYRGCRGLKCYPPRQGSASARLAP